jgi:hypothetical protein
LISRKPLCCNFIVFQFSQCSRLISTRFNIAITIV